MFTFIYNINLIAIILKSISIYRCPKGAGHKLAEKNIRTKQTKKKIKIF